MKVEQRVKGIKLESDFYQREDVVGIARELLGKVLCTHVDGKLTSGIITETEAYEGITDRASHAYNNRRTLRTEVMYREGGTAYVYLCYGIHSLFNVVTSVDGNPHAVLIRSIAPLEGEEIMKQRAGKLKIGIKEGRGPGNVSKLLGIHFNQTGSSLVEVNNSLVGNAEIWIEDRGIIIDGSMIKSGPRIGVSYAGTDALLPYRFLLEDAEINQLLAAYK